MFFSTGIIFKVRILADSRLFIQQQHEQDVQKQIKLHFFPLKFSKEFARCTDWTLGGCVVICLHTQRQFN